VVDCDRTFIIGESSVAVLGVFIVVGFVISSGRSFLPVRPVYDMPESGLSWRCLPPR